MIVDLALLVVGLIVLVKSADQFVLGSSRLAGVLSLPPVVIGAVVMGFGTSAPELIVSSIAAAGGDRDLGVGNIVGSNVANLSLVLGTAAFIARMDIPRVVFRREAPLAIGSAALFSLFVADRYLGRLEGTLLVIGLVSVIAWLVLGGHRDVLPDIVPTHQPWHESGRTALGLVGTVIGAQLVVAAATDVAEGIGVSGGFIGFSLVALGTSLPELVTTVACSRRGETELIVGNLFGSNIFNAFAVGGAMGLVGPGEITDASLTGIGLVFMLAIALLAFGLGMVGHFVDRRDGVVLLAAYVAAMLTLGVGSSEIPEESEDGAAAIVAASEPAEPPPGQPSDAAGGR